MAGLIIRDIPEELHNKLKQQAAQHHRSMNKEAIALLEHALTVDNVAREIPPPYHGKRKLTGAFINKAKREGRA